ncbi:MAG: WD40 repeat domain-containing protein [Spirochaetaceae bacterium]|nr:WD40 repeat domain-containing protein [Spirochaetaceae bacterium]
MIVAIAFSAQARENSDGGWVTLPEIGFVAPAHRGAVNFIAVDETGRVLSAGEDGFIGIWDSNEMRARERFQLSSCPVEKIAARPGKSEVAAYESDGLWFYRVSVWDYVKKERLFSISFTEPVLFCGYTAKGKYLVLGFNDGFSFYNPKNGELRGGRLGGCPVTFATSSPTERTLQTYSPSGALSYWDIDNLTLSRSFSVPANLDSPLAFGSYRFLAGQDEKELFVIDAVSGRILYKTPSIQGGVLLCADGDESLFFRLSPAYGEDGEDEGFTREDFAVGVSGDTGDAYGDDDGSEGLVRRVETFIKAEAAFSAAAPLGESRALTGFDDGRLAVCAEGSTDFFLFRNQTLLTDAAAAADGGIAFTDGNGRGAFIPSGFYEKPEADSVILFDSGTANRVATDDGKTFLFWRYGAGADGGSARDFPFAKTFEEQGARDAVAIGDSGALRRLRSASIYGKNALFLDFSGGITVFSLEDRRPVFSYAAALSLDAAFVDGRGMLIARGSEAEPAAPFLLVDYVSGETLPEEYPASMAFMLYKNRRNSIFSAVLRSVERRIKTEVIKFDTQNPRNSPVILSYDGEDTEFSFIEYGADDERYAATAGGEGAFIISDGDLTFAGRAPAFPQKLLPLNGSFAALDGDGSLAWYDGTSGKLLAMLRLYEDEWLLSTVNGTARGRLEPR